MDWNDIKIFLALVRHGSVRAAGDRLGVSHSTVARRIDALESELKVRLFERRSTGYAITAAGEEILTVAEGVEGDLMQIERRVLGSDQRLAGDVRFTTADFLATHLLMPHLASFCELYPDIHVEVVTTYDALDLNKREADVALRFTRNPPGNLVGRQVATLSQAPYATPAYLARHELGPGSSAVWIGFEGRAPFPKWVREGPLPHLPSRGCFQSLLVQKEAARAGMGIAMLPCLLGDADAGLVRLPGIAPQPVFDLWLLTHREVRSSARLRVFMQFMTQALAAERARLEGTGVGASGRSLASPARKAKLDAASHASRRAGVG